jgi:ATP-dependent exoDNAse (exonuclease V) beta subunit
LEPEEINVLYVAMTRASHTLELHRDMKSFLDKAEMVHAEAT